MIEKILEKLDELGKHCLSVYDYNGHKIAVESYEIVQEVAKEYKAPSRCITCARYTDADTIDNICYLCCKGIEDNYVTKEGE